MVNYISAERALKTFLLALPQLQDDHSGASIANSVLDDIKEFKIEDRLGYFMLDNASNNDTCIAELGEQVGFKP